MIENYPKRPLLAATCEDETRIRYPCIASPKLDGIRALHRGGALVSRKFLPIPNHYIRETLEKILPPEPLVSDGEIMVGADFSACTSAVMSRDGRPDFVFWMFDLVDPTDPREPYRDRLERMDSWIWTQKRDVPVIVTPTQWIQDPNELQQFERVCLSNGFEGIIVRDPMGKYKEGRSTAREGILLKIKRFKDSEAEIIGFEELHKNTNEAKTDHLGLTKRSHKKAGKVPAGTLGKFKVRDLKSRKEFKIGTGKGLTHAHRKQIWDNRETYLGKIVKYKYQLHGTKDKPRSAVWLGWRDERDL